jgi:non-heme chloroperoxidase
MISGAHHDQPTPAELRRPCSGRGDVVERSDGTRLRVVTAGTGPPVVLVHGFGVSADEWNLVQPSLVADHWTVLAYDHRGHGRSTLGSDGLTATALWRDFAAVLASHDVTEAIIVCHSMGNFVGLGALGFWPELQRRVRAIVCVAPVTGHAARGAPAARLQIPLVRAGVAQRLAAIPPAGRLLARANLGPRVSDPVVEATRRVLCEIPRQLAPLAAMLARESITSALPAIDVPVTVLSGDADRLTPRWHADLIVERIARARLLSLPGVGHMVNWESPDAIVAAVQDFRR